jgi:5''-nucleotidase/2'',3''-cyclic phosphodiesterase and related esterases
MERVKYCISISLLLLFVTPTMAQRLTFIHTSDSHSRIEPFVRDTSNPHADTGGFARRAAFVKEARLDAPDLFLIDCGDFSQGTPYYNMYKGDLEVILMNKMGYDVVALGNHEFGLGLDNLARLYRMAEFEIVCANYDLTNTPLEGLVKPYTIIERNGVKVGFFGLSPRLDGLVLWDHHEGVVYHDPIETANRVAAQLKAKGCDVIVCLSHLGIHIAGLNAIGDESLIPQTRNIDFVFGGHSHTYMTEPEEYYNLDGKSVKVLHTGKNASFVGKVEIILEQK